MATRHFLVLLLCFFGFMRLSGQMVVGTDTLVGNEWITYGQTYFKFVIDADGVYRIPYASLAAAGIAAEATGSALRVYSLGKQVPLYVSTDGFFGPDDFVEFYGYKNRGELDRHLFRKPDSDMLNPDQSMYTDRRAYYLTTAGIDIPLRVTTLSNNLSNPPAPELYYLHKEIIEFTAGSNDPYFPIDGGGAISYSSYLHGEGFCKNAEPNSTTQINTSDRTAGPDATLHLRLTSTNHGEHEFVVTWNGEVIDTIISDSIEISDVSYTLPLSKIQDINQLNVSNTNAVSRHSLVFVVLTYPRLIKLNGLSESVLTLDQNPGDQYVVIDGFAHNGSLPLVYSTDERLRMETNINGNDQVHFLWPEEDQETSLRILNPVTSIKTITSLDEKVFTDYTSDDTEYIVITHPDLMEPGTESEYIQYRSSAAGGSYRAKAYSIIDLYEQYGYGVDKHPMAIRNFVEFFQRNWPSSKMIFIVGRAIEYNRSRYENGSWESSFFVPTFGRPGADNLLAATLWDLVPRYPIGRLAIKNAEGIATYLEKVKEHDLSRFAGQTLADKQWIKNVMHLGGGKTTSEQNNFAFVLKSLENDISSSGYGADVSFFEKKSTDEVGESESAQILKLLNEGCGIINYLGHSASSTLQFSINDPTEWNNKGRYPIFSAMGCSAGQIHGTSLSLSDNYVQIKDEGTVAFISGSGSQFPSALIAWARPWYNYFGNLNYGTTLGESILFGLKALENYVDLDKPTTSNSYRYLLEQQTFQGDPALQLHPFPGPDYVVDRHSVSISPEILNTKVDSFDLRFSIVNIGRNLKQNVNYSILIRFPDGHDIEVRNDTITVDKFASVVHTRIPLMTGGKSGAFRLLVRIDPNNVLEELPAPDAETNNQLIDNLNIEGIEFFVVDNLISAVYPPDFSIVNTSIPELIATGSNSFSKLQDIAFEIDTTALFNSPSLVRDKFIDHSSTLKWSPPINWIPDQVYYWRVSTDSISPEQGYLWSKKSFLYKPGSSPGWNQSHFHQFTDNDLDQILVDSTKRTFTFGTTTRNFSILNRYHDIAQDLIPKVIVGGSIKAEFFTGFRTRNVNVFVVAIDSVTGDYLYNPNPGLYGSFSHLSFDAPCFPYRTDLPESRQALIDFVENVIPSGYYVFFYTYQRPGYPDFYPEQWAADEAIYGKSIFTMIENQFPSSAIRTLEMTGSKPYIVFFQKDRGGIQELIAADTSDVIAMNIDIKESYAKGRHISRLVGPASRWYSILNETAIPSPDSSGNNVLSAIALSADLTDTLLISEQIISQDTTIEAIDAKAYPYIRLTYSTQDSMTYNPSDLLLWRVLYEGYPEFVIQPDMGFEFESDTLHRGETMRLWTNIENVSSYDIDSLPVSLRIISENNSTEILSTSIPELKGHSFAAVEFEKNTGAYEGNYQVLMEVNPGRTINEFNYNNNIGIVPMHVLPDQANPVLDVTFDGYRIKDGDLVASKPLIMIQLYDENQNLRLEDTSSFVMYLEYPADNEPKRIYFTEPWAQFIASPASGPNVATAQLTPELLENGIYTLFVNAKDASGNIAGDNDYMVSFEVINETSVSYIYNYPNPFSSSTRFIYTLTGPGTPSFYKIEILSITGVLVREISQDEMGPLAVGDHMTEYSWDGTAQTGSELPSGIYLYRLIVKDENMREYSRYVPYGDSTYTNEGWGKLAIIR